MVAYRGQHGGDLGPVTVASGEGREWSRWYWDCTLLYEVQVLA